MQRTKRLISRVLHLTFIGTATLLATASHASDCYFAFREIKDRNANKTVINVQAFEGRPGGCSAEAINRIYNSIPKEAQPGFEVAIQTLTSNRHHPTSNDVINPHQPKPIDPDLGGASPVVIFSSSSTTTQVPTSGRIGTDYNPESTLLPTQITTSYLPPSQNFLSSENIAAAANAGLAVYRLFESGTLSAAGKEIATAWDAIILGAPQSDAIAAQDRLQTVQKALQDFEKFRQAAMLKSQETAQENVRLSLSVQVKMSTLVHDQKAAVQQVTEALNQSANASKKAIDGIKTQKYTFNSHAQAALAGSTQQIADLKNGMISPGGIRKLASRIHQKMDGNRPQDGVREVRALQAMIRAEKNPLLREQYQNLYNTIVTEDGLISELSAKTPELQQIELATNSTTKDGSHVRDSLNDAMALRQVDAKKGQTALTLAVQLDRASAIQDGGKTFERIYQRGKAYLDYATSSEAKMLRQQQTFSPAAQSLYGTEINSSTYEGNQIVQVGNAFACINKVSEDEIIRAITTLTIDQANFTATNSDADAFDSALNRSYEVLDAVTEFAKNGVSSFSSAVYEAASGTLKQVQSSIDSLENLQREIILGHTFDRLTKEYAKMMTKLQAENAAFYGKDYSKFWTDERQKEYIKNLIESSALGIAPGPSGASIRLLSVAKSAVTTIFPEIRYGLQGLAHAEIYLPGTLRNAFASVEFQKALTFGRNVLSWSPSTSEKLLLYKDKLGLGFAETLHVSEFKQGFSYFLTKEQYETYVVNSARLGRQDGFLFVTSKQAADQLVREAGSIASTFEFKLGKEIGSLQGKTLIRVDLPFDLGFLPRLPTGLEAAANQRYFKGSFTTKGFTSGGMPEVVLKDVPSIVHVKAQTIQLNH